MTTRPSVAIIGGGIGGLFAANALIAQGRPRLGLRAGARARRDRRRRLPHAERRAPSRARRPRPRGREMGRAGRPGVALLPPRRHADRAGAGRPTPPAGTPPTACTAPTWSSLLAAHLPAGRRPHRPPRHRLRAGRRQGTRHVRQRRHRRGRRRGRAPTASTPSCGRTSFRRRKPVFHGTISYRGLVARERLPDWPMDRWQMWAGPRSTSWSSRCATARWSTTSASCRPTRR